MGRAKTAVGILAAASLLATSIVLAVEPPDKVEQLLRSSGHHSTMDADTLSAQAVCVRTWIPSQMPRLTPVYQELTRRGWHEASGQMTPRPQLTLIPPSAHAGEAVGFYFHGPRTDVQVRYMRHTTPRERFFIRTRRLLRLPS